MVKNEEEINFDANLEALDNAKKEAISRENNFFQDQAQKLTIDTYLILISSAIISAFLLLGFVNMPVEQIISIWAVVEALFIATTSSINLHISNKNQKKHYHNLAMIQNAYLKKSRELRQQKIKNISSVRKIEISKKIKVMSFEDLCANLNIKDASDMDYPRVANIMAYLALLKDKNDAQALKEKSKCYQELEMIYDKHHQMPRKLRK